MRDNRLSVADRAAKLVQSHQEWILAEAKQWEEHDDMNSFDDIVDTVTYGYLECVCSPLEGVTLFDDEMEPEGNFYTTEFVDAVSVAIEKLLG